MVNHDCISHLSHLQLMKIISIGLRFRDQEYRPQWGINHLQPKIFAFHTTYWDHSKLDEVSGFHLREQSILLLVVLLGICAGCLVGNIRL